MPGKDAYRLEPIPPMRRFSLDAGYLGRRRNIVHGLLEVDVTGARQLIHQHQQRTGERLSFTAYVIHCLNRAIQQHPHTHAYRDWRNRLVIYDDINITAMFEVEFAAIKTPMPHLFRATNRKTLRQLHDELRSVQTTPHASTESRFMHWFLYLPAFLRRAFYWVVMRVPNSFRDRSSPVMVTAVGMFGRGGGWAITLPNFTLTITVGGISRKPAVHNDQIAIRDILDLTISLDHDIVDGAPAARFAQTFRSLLEVAHGLRQLTEASPYSDPPGSS
jgi:hypothetical protein